MAVRRVGNLQGETGNPSRGRPGPLPTRFSKLKTKRIETKTVRNKLRTLHGAGLNQVLLVFLA